MLSYTERIRNASTDSGWLRVEINQLAHPFIYAWVSDPVIVGLWFSSGKVTPTQGDGQAAPHCHLQDGGRSLSLAWPQVLGGWALVILCWPLLWYHVITPIADLALGKRPLLPEDEQVGRARLAPTTHAACLHACMLGPLSRAALAAQAAGHVRAVHALSLRHRQ